MFSIHTETKSRHFKIPFLDGLVYTVSLTIEIPAGGGGGSTLGISRWGCAAETLEPLAYTRASSAEFCYPILE